MRELLDDFKPYINQNGMVPFTNPPGGTTQNCTLFTAYYLCAINDNMVSDDLVDHDLTAEIMRLVDAYSKHIDATGMPRRKPGDDELESNDNLIGIGYASYTLSPSFARLILAYFRSTGWYWGGLDSPKAYLGRHRAVEAHLQLAGQIEKPDFFTQIPWLISVLISCFKSKNDQDNFSLSYLMTRLVSDAYRDGCDVPFLMLFGALTWKMVWKFRGMTMKQNLINYGWAGSPHVRWLRS